MPASSALGRGHRHAQLLRRTLRLHMRSAPHCSFICTKRQQALNYHLLFASFFLEGETQVCQTGPWELWPHMYCFQFGMTGQFFIYSQKLILTQNYPGKAQLKHA